MFIRAVFIPFIKKYKVILNENEYKEEIKNLAEKFKMSEEDTKKRLKDVFVVTEEISEEFEEPEDYKLHKKLEEEINNLPSMIELSEIYCELSELYKNAFVNKNKIGELEVKRKELEEKLEEEKKVLWKEKFENNKSKNDDEISKMFEDYFGDGKLDF